MYPRNHSFTLKNAWLRSPPKSLLYMLFCMIGFPPSNKAIPRVTASSNMDGEFIEFITSSITRSDAPSRSKWHCTSCNVRSARFKNFAANKSQEMKPIMWRITHLDKHDHTSRTVTNRIIVHIFQQIRFIRSGFGGERFLEISNQQTVSQTVTLKRTKDIKKKKKNHRLFRKENLTLTFSPYSKSTDIISPRVFRILTQSFSSFSSSSFSVCLINLKTKKT